jgi:MFS transporter, DHA2 family, multidrug resistance protein
MLTICLGVILSGLDGIIVSVALPSIAADLGIEADASVWAATAYQLAVIVSLLPFSALGEAAGFRRIYLAGMAVFTASSLACGLSSSLAALIIWRIVQGLGGGAMVGVSMALVRIITPRERLGRAIALYGLTAAASLTFGPSIAAAILAVAHWPWLFAVNVPIGIAALALGARLLPQGKPAPRRFDAAGALISAVMFVALITGIDALGDADGRVRGFVFLGISAVLALLLLREQTQRDAPLFPVDLLRLPLFSLSIGTSISAYAAQTCAFVALPFLFQQRLGLSAVETGLFMTPWPLMNVVAAPIAGRLTDRLPARLISSISLTGLIAGLVLLSLLQPGASVLAIGAAMALCGIGIGFFQTPNNRTLMTAGPPQRSGAASGMVAVARMLGQAVGSATAAMAFGLYATRGTVVAMWLAASWAILAVALSVARPRGKAPR